MIRAPFTEESLPDACAQIIAFFVEVRTLHRHESPVRIDYANSEVVDRIRPPATRLDAGRGSCGWGWGWGDCASNLRDRIVKPFVAEIERHVDTSGRYAANRFRSSDESTEKAHSRVDPVNVYEQATVTPAHLNAGKLDANQRDPRLLDLHFYAEARPNKTGRPRCRARRTPHKKADHEHQRDEGRDQPCASLAEKPQHRGRIMPCLKREA